MFNVGGGEIMLIAFIALLVLGPDKLPEFARKSAKLLGQVRQISEGFQNEMRSVIDLDDDTPTATPSRGPRLVGPIEPSDPDPVPPTPDTKDADGVDTAPSATDAPPTPSDTPPDLDNTHHDDGSSASGPSAA